MGNIYVSGKSKNAAGNFDYATVRYDTDGNELWEVRYDGPGEDLDEVRAAVLDFWGNVYVTGRSYDSGTNYDYATIKYSQ